MNLFPWSRKLDDLIHRFFSDLSTVVTESTGELTILFLILLLFVVIVLIGFYVYNRTQKLNKLDRPIPASLVRSHLNSIIKNSNDLKESLFIDEAAGTQPEPKNELLALKEELKNKEKIILELAQKKVTEAAPAPIILENQPSNEELAKVIKERDDLLLRVSDYQKAEEDFAKLKKLKEENEELKKKLGIAVVEPTTETIVVAEAQKPVEDVQILNFEIPSEGEAKPELATENIEKAKEEKSAEELLKEFEKMLG